MIIAKYPGHYIDEDKHGTMTCSCRRKCYPVEKEQAKRRIDRILQRVGIVPLLTSAKEDSDAIEARNNASMARCYAQLKEERIKFLATPIAVLKAHNDSCVNLHIISKQSTQAKTLDVYYQRFV